MTDALCAERDDIVQYIARAVEGLIGSFVGNRESARKLDLATKNHNKVRCLEGCALVEKRLHFVMQGLREEDLWPVTRLEQLPLGGTLRGLQDSRVSSANVEAYSREYVCDASVCVATSDVEPFESKPLLPWADEIMSDCGKLKPLPWVDEIMSRCRKRCQEVKSLCYLCVREGDVELLTEEGCKHERAAA